MLQIRLDSKQHAQLWFESNKKKLQSLPRLTGELRKKTYFKELFYSKKINFSPHKLIAHFS